MPTIYEWILQTFFINDSLRLFQEPCTWLLSQLTDFCPLKLVSATFYQIFIFHQMIALQKLWKMFFISPKKLISFSRYSNFCIFFSPSFFPCQPLLRGWFKKNFKIYDLINCLIKNLITHFVWCLEKEIYKVWHWNCPFIEY